jgi:hypothetical protein
MVQFVAVKKVYFICDRLKTSCSALNLCELPFIAMQMRTDQHDNIERASYLKSGDGDRAEGWPGHVEEESLQLADG